MFSLPSPEDGGGLGLGLADAAVVFEELGRALVPGPLLATHLAAGSSRALADGEVVVGAVSRPGSGGRAGCIGPGEPRRRRRTSAHWARWWWWVTTGWPWSTPPTLEAVAVDRSLDPLTPAVALDPLPAGDTIGGPEERGAVAAGRGGARRALLVGLAAATVDLAVGLRQGPRAVRQADRVVPGREAPVRRHAGAFRDGPGRGPRGRGDDRPARRGRRRRGPRPGRGLLAAEAAVANASSCIQVHGGMGFTWEVPAHLYLMRARVLAGALGGTDALAEIVAERY